MAGWQELGRRVRDQIREAKRAKQLLAIGESPAYAFCRVLNQYSMGNPHPLKERLRSGRPLSPADCELLALHLSGELSHPLKRGRPPNENARTAVGVAIGIFLKWKAENKRAGIKDGRLRSEMKEQSCRYAIEILKPLIEGIGGEIPEFDGLLEMMEREVYRQR